MRNMNGSSRAHAHSHGHSSASHSLSRSAATTKAKSAPTQFPPPQRAPPAPQVVHQAMYYPQPQAPVQRRHSHAQTHTQTQTQSRAQSHPQQHHGGVYVPSLRQSTSQPLLRTHTHSQPQAAQQESHAAQQQQQQQQSHAQPKKRKRRESAHSATPRGQGPTSSAVCLKKYRIEDESFRVWSYYKPTSSKLLGRGGYGVVMEA